jgi:hypothetical protein
MTLRYEVRSSPIDGAAWDDMVPVLETDCMGEAKKAMLATLRGGLYTRQRDNAPDTPNAVTDEERASLALITPRMPGSAG